MSRYRKLLMKRLTIDKRVDILVDLAEQRVNPAVSKAALERADELSGLTTPKTLPQDVPLINLELATMVGVQPIQVVNSPPTPTIQVQGPPPATAPGTQEGTHRG